MEGKEKGAKLLTNIYIVLGVIVEAYGASEHLDSTLYTRKILKLIIYKVLPEKH